MPVRTGRQPSYAAITVAICFVIQALGVGTYIAFGVFFNPLMEAFGWSRAAISGAASTAFFSMGVFGILVGRLNDRFGPRPILTVTALLMGLGCALMARLSTLWELYLYYGIIFGMGLSAIDVIALTTVARWFTHRRGFMTGIVKVGTGAGQFVIPLAASGLILIYGWRWSFVFIGGGVALVLVTIAQWIRRDPRAAGLTILPEDGNPAGASILPTSSLALGKSLKTVQFWTICLANLLLVFCLMIVMLHIVPHARDLGLAPIRAAGVLSTIGAVSMLGRFVGGMVIDRRGSKTVMTACFFLLLFGLIWLQFAHHPWMLYLFAVVYGLAHGGFFTAISPLVAEWFGIGSHGTLFGIVVFFGTAGGSFGPLIAGHLFDHCGSYQSTFRLITVMAMIAWGLLFSLKPVDKRARK
ncbi:MFS transporter [uncultured Desulfosarcina sp.]|uniref:MFS transporter n=1 Tax=uncultured Desulfosarcina sp. TaxID=218289 RepID=UPI0029C9207A|nr:MFS transporter [uncultured Desulfosarcina sp.]